MQPAKERRKHQRQQVLLPLRVTEEDARGKLLFQGNTVNVGAGGVYFKTLNWQGIPLGTTVHLIIDVPPEMFQLLPFGGLRGAGKVVRMDTWPSPDIRSTVEASLPPEDRGVAIRMISRLRFDPDLHLPRFESDQQRPS